MSFRPFAKRHLATFVLFALSSACVQRSQNDTSKPRSAELIIKGSKLASKVGMVWTETKKAPNGELYSCFLTSSKQRLKGAQQPLEKAEYQDLFNRLRVPKVTPEAKEVLKMIASFIRTGSSENRVARPVHHKTFLRYLAEAAPGQKAIEDAEAKLNFERRLRTYAYATELVAGGAQILSLVRGVPFVISWLELQAGGDGSVGEAAEIAGATVGALVSGLVIWKKAFPHLAEAQEKVSTARRNLVEAKTSAQALSELLLVLQKSGQAAEEDQQKAVQPRPVSNPLPSVDRTTQQLAYKLFEFIQFDETGKLINILEDFNPEIDRVLYGETCPQTSFEISLTNDLQVLQTAQDP